MFHGLPRKRRAGELRRDILRYPQNKAACAKYGALCSELTKLPDVKYCADRALSAREDESRETRRLSANITSL